MRSRPNRRPSRPSARNTRFGALPNNPFILPANLCPRGGAALSGLLLIPLAVPLLVCGAGALATGGDSGIAWTAALSLLLVAITPFAGGAAIRAAQEG